MDAPRERKRLDCQPRGRSRFARMMRAIRFCPKPMVARAQEYVFGRGVGLCAACDILVTSANASFSVSEARFGPAPGASTGSYCRANVGNTGIGRRGDSSSHRCPGSMMLPRPLLEN